LQQQPYEFFAGISGGSYDRYVCLCHVWLMNKASGDEIKRR
jgi:hypothetical protein